MQTTLKKNKTNSSTLIGGNLFDYENREVDPKVLRPHPDNTYSMDENEFQELLQNIAEVGLIEVPLVREVDDGGLQILSGHRRVKACAKLASKDDRFKTIPVRVVRGISDQDALLILHSGNIGRDLPRAERVKQFELLKERVAEIRETHPEWQGLRSDEIIAAILGFSSVSTYKRQKIIAMNLPDGLYEMYDKDLITAGKAYDISVKDQAYRDGLEKYMAEKHPSTKEEAQAFINQYDKGASEYLIKMQSYIHKADVALFMARDILRKNNIISPSDRERMWDMRETLDKMIKGSRIKR